LLDTGLTTVTYVREDAMKRMIAVSALVMSMVGAATAQQPAKPAGSTAAGSVSQALLDLENQWVKASKASDGDGVGALLAENFVGIDSEGKVESKADVVAKVKKAKWVSQELSDMKVIPHGDSAIVTGSWAGNGTDGSGKTVNTKERWGDTWVKMPSGKWQCVASISTPLK
jgi:ketosteroid isomerase-like protein